MKPKGFTYDEELVARKMCGKRGSPADLASAFGMDASVLTRILRQMRDGGHPVVVAQHPIAGTIYSYESKPRTCVKRGCHTRLSRYNSSDYCSIHQPEEDLPQDWFLMPNHYAKEKP